MSDGPELFSVAIGQYESFDPLDVDSEVDAVAELLADFGCRVVDWDLPMSARNADAVATRLAEWKASEIPNAILYWVGHGWSDGDRAALAHVRSERSIQTSGIQPMMIADTVGNRNRASPWHGSLW